MPFRAAHALTPRMSRSLCTQILRHQWLCILRSDSAAGTLIVLVSRWGAFFGTCLLGIALAVVPADAAGTAALRDDVTRFLADYVAAVILGGWSFNLWLSAQGGIDLSAYRFYPVSLGGIALLVQIRRTMKVRYLVTLAAAVTGHLLTGHLGFAGWAASGLLVVLFDCTALFVQALHGTRPWASYAVLVLVPIIAFADVHGGHFVSGYVFAIWTHGQRTTSILLISLVTLTATAAALSHRMIETRLRYIK